MSAFMVEDKTINRIISYLCNGAEREIPHATRGISLFTKEDKEVFGKSLFDLNIAGVNARYGEGEAEKFRPLDYCYCSELPPHTVQAYKSLQCFLYQCSEGNVPEDPLYKKMEGIVNALAHHIVNDLKIYQESKWD